MRPVQDRRPQLGRLDRILAALPEQRLADENHAGKPVEKPEFAHGVADIDLRRRVDRLVQRALGDVEAGGARQVGDVAAPMRVARRHDGQQAGKLPRQLLVDAQGQRLFAGMGRGGDPDLARADLAGQDFELVPDRWAAHRRHI